MNIALTLVRSAERWPFQRAVVVPAGRDRAGRATYAQMTFRQLDDESRRLAAGLRRMGVTRGSRIVLMVRPGLEFLALTYALFKAGAVVVLIDPGMGVKNVFRCLEDVDPEGFVAVPPVHAARLLSRRFPRSKLNVTVGRRWFWRGPTYAELARVEEPGFVAQKVASTDPAAILFTSGSTGPAKGVLYEHGMFAAQVDALRDYFRIQPGEIDLPGFPLFALFNAAMGVTTVIPDMDPTRPARVNPAKIVEAITNQGVTQAFGSPAIWNRVGRYCEALKITLPSLRRVLSAGAPLPEHVLRRMSGTLVGDAGMFTPYGATEALPVSAISAREVLESTAHLTSRGKGTCVGHVFPNVRVKIVEITEGPISSLDQVRELPAGEVGEILVSSPSVTREYFHRPEATALAKVPEGERFWHRMGDVGYLDTEGRLWFCGRKSHVVETAHGRLYTDCVEPVFNVHPQIYRTALVGTGDKPHQMPVVIVELEGNRVPTGSDKDALLTELKTLGATCDQTRSIDQFLFHPSLPVDVRHNVKINREALSEWASGQ